MSSQDPAIRLLCDGMTWDPIAKCGPGLVCDTQRGPNYGLCTMSAAGTSGAGSGDSPPGVVLYTACSTLGALDCSLANPKVQVLCDGMTWNPMGECSGQLVCDTSSGPQQGLCTASAAGTSDAGSGDSPPGVVLYTACSTLGALDCSLANPKVQVLCDGMTWNPIGECSGQLVCDTSPGPDQGLCTASDGGISADGAWRWDPWSAADDCPSSLRSGGRSPLNASIVGQTMRVDSDRSLSTCRRVADVTDDRRTMPRPRLPWRGRRRTPAAASVLIRHIQRRSASKPIARHARRPSPRFWREGWPRHRGWRSMLNPRTYAPRGGDLPRRKLRHSGVVHRRRASVAKITYTAGVADDFAVEYGGVTRRCSALSAFLGSGGCGQPAVPADGRAGRPSDSFARPPLNGSIVGQTEWHGLAAAIALSGAQANC